MASLAEAAASELTLMAGATVGEVVNSSRDAVFGFHENEIAGYQWSAILDMDTCKRCRALDGRTFRKGDKGLQFLGPQLHQHCRCILVAILKEEARDDITFFDVPLSPVELQKIVGTSPTSASVVRGGVKQSIQNQFQEQVTATRSQFRELIEEGRLNPGDGLEMEAALEKLLSEQERKARNTLWTSWAKEADSEAVLAIRSFAAENLGGARVNYLFQEARPLPAFSELGLHVDLGEEVVRSVLTKEYAVAQEIVAQRQVRQLTLYRGTGWIDDASGLYGNHAPLPSNAATSFSMELEAAGEFVEGADNPLILRGEIKAEQVLSSHEWNTNLIGEELEWVIAPGDEELLVDILDPEEFLEGTGFFTQEEKTMQLNQGKKMRPINPDLLAGPDWLQQVHRQREQVKRKKSQKKKTK